MRTIVALIVTLCACGVEQETTSTSTDEQAAISTGGDDGGDFPGDDPVEYGEDLTRDALHAGYPDAVALSARCGWPGPHILECVLIVDNGLPITGIMCVIQFSSNHRSVVLAACRFL